MSKLLPCPFCGAFSDLLLALDEDNKGDAYYAHCRACESDGPSADDVHNASYLWNNRPAPTLAAKLDEAVELLRSVIEESEGEECGGISRMTDCAINAFLAAIDAESARGTR